MTEIEVMPAERLHFETVSGPISRTTYYRIASLKPTDDLDSLPGLRNAKTQWESSVEQTQQKVDKKTELGTEIESGKVKSRLSKFVEGGMEEEEHEPEETDSGNPNIIKNSKRTQKDQLNVEVGSIKNKWEKGEMETAHEKEDRTGELDELKKNVKVKERFRERVGSEPEDQEHRKSVMEQEQLDTSFSSSARERFKKGEAFQDSAPVEKTAQDDVKFNELSSFKQRFENAEAAQPVEKAPVDVRCAELGKFKETFEQGEKAGKGAEGADPQDQKRQQIEAEFRRYKKERRKQELKEQREKESPAGGESPDQETADGQEGAVPNKNADDVRHSAEMGSIKQRFEEGTAFKSEESSKKQDEQLEMKVAGKAREKFRQIDAEAPKEPLLPGGQRGGAAESKWKKDDKPMPEPINRRKMEDSDSDEESYEVKNLLNKFKNIEKGPEEGGVAGGPKPKRQITPPPADYRAEIESSGGARDPNVVLSGATGEDAGRMRADAKNIKAKFEAGGVPVEEDAEEKRKRLEDEFKKYKELKATQVVEDEPEPEPEIDKEELGIAPEHATKMKQKWEKIHRKEAKKAGKTAPRRTTVARTPMPVFCFVCDDKVYLAEQLECDGRYFHKRCFKCHVCNMSLRMENYAAGPDAIFCKNHYRQLYNNLTRPLYNGSSRSSTSLG